MSETQWASDQLMLQVDKHTRGLETHASFDPRQNCLVLVAWLPKTSFCIQVEIRLVTKSLSETVFVRMCVIIWEELRGSCWEDICVRAWHLTLDLWMEFTHTHTHTHTHKHSLIPAAEERSLPLLRCLSIDWHWLMRSKFVLLLCQRQYKEEETICMLKNEWEKA